MTVLGLAGWLTGTGRTTVALACVAAVVGSVTGWAEWWLVAAVLGSCVLAASAWVLRAPTLEVDLLAPSTTVVRGRPLLASLTISGHGVDRSTVVTLPPLDPITVDAGKDRRSASHPVELPTDERGFHRIGPLRVERRDPLGLWTRAIAVGRPFDYVVEPDRIVVPPMPQGFATDRDGDTDERSRPGDLSFETIRPYAEGDDPRRIHWLSSARTGSVVVRQLVDDRRCDALVVLDRSGDPGPGFELAVDVAASVTDVQPVVELAGGSGSIHRRLVEAVPDGTTLATQLAAGLGSASVVVVVSDTAATLELARAASRIDRPVVVIRCGSSSEPVPGTITIAIERLDQLPERWRARL